MTKFQSKPRRGRVVLAIMLGAMVMVGCSALSARAADDEDQPSLFDKMMHALGLRNDNDLGIEYRERSPLVLPTGQALPPPEVNKLPSKAEGWPDDPDIKRARARKEAERKRGREDPDLVRPLTPAQLNVPGAASRRSRPDGRDTGSVEAESRPMSPYALGSKNPFTSSSIWAPKEEYATFAGEPPRTTLTEPPAGYRTPSPNQPYGVGQEKWTPEQRGRHEIAR
jgi:hypothetical protein